MLPISISAHLLSQASNLEIILDVFFSLIYSDILPDLSLKYFSGPALPLHCTAHGGQVMGTAYPPCWTMLQSRVPTTSSHSKSSPATLEVNRYSVKKDPGDKYLENNDVFIFLSLFCEMCFIQCLQQGDIIDNIPQTG